MPAAHRPEQSGGPCGSAGRRPKRRQPQTWRAPSSPSETSSSCSPFQTCLGAINAAPEVWFGPTAETPADPNSATHLAQSLTKGCDCDATIAWVFVATLCHGLGVSRSLAMQVHHALTIGSLP